jgi:hypothetical protein
VFAQNRSGLKSCTSRRYPCPDNNQDYRDAVQSFPHLRLYAVCESMIDSGDLTVAYKVIRGPEIYSRFQFIK